VETVGKPVVLKRLINFSFLDIFKPDNMKSIVITILIIQLAFYSALGQNTNFGFSVELKPIQIEGFNGLHSFAFGQHDGKWLIIGGRTDGLHPRQPFNSFQQSDNNTEILVIDVVEKKVWTHSVNALSQSLKEQLQSTNMSFYQDGNILYIIGGYAYSPSAGDHVTFPYLTSINVPAVIQAVINGEDSETFIKQATDDFFAISGGQLGKINDVFYLVGGHRFDGRYNPHDNPTFTQTYSNQIRKFTIEENSDLLSFSIDSTITDEVHLRRRDYNLLPQIFPDGKHGYTISAGVFQMQTDLPFLYPVDITAEGYYPHTEFNQYLSHYHGAKACLYDAENNSMHNLFFGGMSQYYYQNDLLIKDDRVPFVNTISRMTRFSDGSLQEFVLPSVMPGLKGASAEFIPNQALPHHPSKIIKLDEIIDSTFIIGHVVGGIESPFLNPFSSNSTSVTTADNQIFEVWLKRNTISGSVDEIDGTNPYEVVILPNPFEQEIQVGFELAHPIDVDYFVTNIKGQLIKQGNFGTTQAGKNIYTINFIGIESQALQITFVFDNKYFITKRMISQGIK
jgi:hypothetical protein